MNPLATLPSTFVCPTLIAVAGDRARLRFLEFFASNIRNRHTRRAYIRAVTEFLDWCAIAAGVSSVVDVEPLHVAAWIEGKTRQLGGPLVFRAITDAWKTPLSLEEFA